ncbi:MAG TPA: hypothetical protein VHX52_10500 [Steroidobacteraceae bacterium]|nr:hypothetical protein [Steroidobacteraceae bacterium]
MNWSIKAPASATNASQHPYKDDVALLRQQTKSDMTLLRSSMMVWLGSIQVVGLGLLFAALKLT